MKAVLVDYGAGNLRSVANALRAVGISPSVASASGELADATHLVLPGVGSFGECMQQLDQRKLLEPVREWILAGRPYFGICLGYQILFEGSEETPGIEGLGLLSGQVCRFSEGPGLKIPHMGWNSVLPTQPSGPTWSGLGPAPYFYYVHSYFPVPDDLSIVAARTQYGTDLFAAAVERPNLLGCQFHPEKSQNAGLQLIRNFFGLASPIVEKSVPSVPDGK